ncbi:MAG: DUF3880 domain-containing protein [Lentisphaerales bacterium]|nr:DUF3880 domain-containing protein [Lentisphaerales bacterium]
MSSSLFKNLELLSKRFPTLGEKICSVNPTSIQVAQTDDGGFCYVKSLENGSYLPLSSTTPIQSSKQAIASMEDRIQNGLAPAVVVGLNPGFILETIYKHFKEYSYDKYIPRRIYVIIDSLECLYGWLKNDDHSEILEHEAVEFYWHEEVNKIVEFCEVDETRSHLFLPMSSLPEQKVMNLIQPLANLFLKREKELKELHQENCAYYEQQSDEELDKILQGDTDRKPRLLIPSHASSTVVQYSVRDTKAMFEKEGWEVEIIHMKTDLSQWRIAKQINAFKPDVYMLVNHLRTEEVDFYPPDMMFITWVQDTVSLINNTNSADNWNTHAKSKEKRRDLIIGYVNQIREYGYLDDRLEECPMIVNEDIFKPRELTPEEIEKYSCDICFASNRSKETSLIVKEDLAPKLSKYGFTQDILIEVQDHLWSWYRAEETCTSYKELEDKISELSNVKAKLNELSDKNDHDFVVQRIFWELNDVIYRHVVLEWIDEIGDIKLHLYGRGWENHPRFSKYAKGILEHGSELSLAYNSAIKCLHLNSMEGHHQRLSEIRKNNSTSLSRYTNQKSNLPKELLKFLEEDSSGLSIKSFNYLKSIFCKKKHVNADAYLETLQKCLVMYEKKSPPSGEVFQSKHELINFSFTTLTTSESNNYSGMLVKSIIKAYRANPFGYSPHKNIKRTLKNIIDFHSLSTNQLVNHFSQANTNDKIEAIMYAINTGQGETACEMMKTLSIKNDLPKFVYPWYVRLSRIYFSRTQAIKALQEWNFKTKVCSALQKIRKAWFIHNYYGEFNTAQKVINSHIKDLPLHNLNFAHNALAIILYNLGEKEESLKLFHKNCSNRWGQYYSFFKAASLIKPTELPYSLSIWEEAKLGMPLLNFYKDLYNHNSVNWENVHFFINNVPSWSISQIWLSMDSLVINESYKNISRIKTTISNSPLISQRFKERPDPASLAKSLYPYHSNSFETDCLKSELSFFQN